LPYYYKGRQERSKAEGESGDYQTTFNEVSGIVWIQIIMVITIESLQLLLSGYERIFDRI
jgi:hypothetical protein